MKIYLLRHGEIEGPGRKRLIGQTDVALSENGKRQLLHWRPLLRGLGVRTVSCSDLARSRESAEILAADIAPTVTVLPGLREIHLGEWDGLTREEIMSRFPGEWEKRGENIAAYRPEGGESFIDLSNRVVPLLESISGGPEDSIVVVGHAGVNRVILCHALGLSVDNLFRLRQDFGALNIIERTGASYQVYLMNRPPE